MPRRARAPAGLLRVPSGAYCSYLIIQAAPASGTRPTAARQAFDCPPCCVSRCSDQTKQPYDFDNPYFHIEDDTERDKPWSAYASVDCAAVPKGSRPKPPAGRLVSEVFGRLTVMDARVSDFQHNSRTAPTWQASQAIGSLPGPATSRAHSIAASTHAQVTGLLRHPGPSTWLPGHSY